MIDIYSTNTSNGMRVAIMLEECKLQYKMTRIDLKKNEQQTPFFLSINPAGKIPVIVDHNGPQGKPLVVSQSYAILIYLAEKTGLFFPQDLLRKTQILQWISHIASDLAPASSNIYYNSALVPEKVEANNIFFEKKFLNLLKLCNDQLAKNVFLMGDEITIADFALCPLIEVRKNLILKNEASPDLMKWFERMTKRTTVATGLVAAKEKI